VKYQLVELEEFSGIKATVYSILPDGTELTSFDTFIESHYELFKEEVQDIIINANQGLKVPLGTKYL